MRLKKSPARGPFSLNAGIQTTIKGRFFYMYLMIDIYSRRIMGWAVHEQETAQHASNLMRATCADNTLDPSGIVLHADNGGPMRGATMLATLHWLGVVPSYSRPRTSNDNPFSEALFRTLKYQTRLPYAPFATLDEARAWGKTAGSRRAVEYALEQT